MGGVSSIQVFFDFWNLFNFANTLSLRAHGSGLISGI